ncbi:MULTISPECIES: Sua5/YciO/YrdC/YwlC family protein [unclassified Luteimonas]
MHPSQAATAQTAAAILRGGGIVAHPTEAVWGLGCDPLDEAATLRLLALKQREVGKGLILVAGTRQQIDAFIDWDALPADRRKAVTSSWPGPHTWVVPASAAVPTWIRGDHAGVAVRVSAHPPVIALCAAFGGPIVSTSANVAGAPPPGRLAELSAQIRAGVDAVLAGDTGGLESPTAIRDALTGAILR